MILLVVLAIVFNLFDIFSDVLVIIIGFGQEALCFVSGLAPLKFFPTEYAVDNQINFIKRI